MNQRTRLKRRTATALRFAGPVRHYYRSDRSTLHWRMIAAMRTIGSSTAELRTTIEESIVLYQRLADEFRALDDEGRAIAYQAFRGGPAPTLTLVDEFADTPRSA